MLSGDRKAGVLAPALSFRAASPLAVFVTGTWKPLPALCFRWSLYKSSYGGQPVKAPSRWTQETATGGKQLPTYVSFLSSCGPQLLAALACHVPASA